LAQLRHVRAAERSGEGAIEDKQDVFCIPKIGQADSCAAIVRKTEVRGNLIEGNA